MRHPLRRDFLCGPILSPLANFFSCHPKPFFPFFVPPPLFFKFMLFSSHLNKSFCLFYHYFLHSTTRGRLLRSGKQHRHLNKSCGWLHDAVYGFYQDYHGNARSCLGAVDQCLEELLHAKLLLNFNSLSVLPCINNTETEHHIGFLYYAWVHLILSSPQEYSQCLKSNLNSFCSFII